LTHAKKWAEEVGVQQIDFTYGVLYGTENSPTRRTGIFSETLRINSHGEQ
jgi:hypothetical protein